MAMFEVLPAPCRFRECVIMYIARFVSDNSTYLLHSDTIFCDLLLVQVLSRWQTNDKIGRFSRPIFSAKLEQVLLLNLSPNYRPIKSGDKVGRVTYKSRQIFCRLIKSADFIVRLSSALRAWRVPEPYNLQVALLNLARVRIRVKLSPVHSDCRVELCCYVQCFRVKVTVMAW